VHHCCRCFATFLLKTTFEMLLLMEEFSNACLPAARTHAHTNAYKNMLTPMPMASSKSDNRESRFDPSRRTLQKVQQCGGCGDGGQRNLRQNIHIQTSLARELDAL